jgi:hypothetical protein
MSYVGNGVRPGHGVKPESWTDAAITQVPAVAPSTSWWINPKTREEFDAKVKQETPRMTLSKFGSVTRVVGD